MKLTDVEREIVKLNRNNNLPGILEIEDLRNLTRRLAKERDAAVQVAVLFCGHDCGHDKESKCRKWVLEEISERMEEKLK